MPGASGCALSTSISCRGLRQRAAEHALDVLARHAAGTQQHGRVEAADDGGLDADLDRPAIDDQIDQAGEIAFDMRGIGGRDVTRQIG